MLIFLHIPKAAGTTLNDILRRQYSQAGAFYQLHHWDPEQIASQFHALPEGRQRSVQIMTGHMHFGVHESLSTPVSYFTLLRDPIDQIISYYYYLLGNPRDPDHDVLVSRGLSLLDFATSGIIPQVDNGQTRLLAGPRGLYSQTSFGHCQEDLLQAAEANLAQHFAVAGLQEQFDATLLLLQRAYRWRTPYYVQRNVTLERPDVGGIPEETYAAIREFNGLDIQLYANVSQQFDKTVTQLGPSFQAAQNRFAVANKFFGVAERFHRWMHGVVPAKHVLVKSKSGKILREGTHRGR